ncbi:helix-turn-helix domain-containing protein [Bacteroides sp. KFT8]|jgi:excisionase family DNA binding protein|uniref:helix-turn-helix domain-containing protein n=1 Tax=Bacteroides sp. KFT8 TaxID=2025659 RepID=UPI000C046C88|nr:helix-turn-helix domain-containing protein [Bacteroides sp. KFT8]
MSTITFENLPVAVEELKQKLDQLLTRFDSIVVKPNQKEDNHVLLNLSEAATLLGKANSTIYCMTSDGRIPYHKTGNKLYFFKDELMKWIESGGLYTNDNSNEVDFNEHLKKMQSGKGRKQTTLVD